MASHFSGFPPEAMAFFRGLKRNNNREWFESHKQIFNEMAKAPMLELVNAINKTMLKWAPDHVTDPQKAIYRIYRDIRFSADKTPYKTHIAAIFPHRLLDKHAGASFYFSVSPSEIDVAGGVYMPGAEQLLAIRTHIAGNHEEFHKIIQARKSRSLMGELQGEQLTRPPKGFPKDHPAINYLRFKQFYIYAGLNPEVATTSELLPELVKRFRATLRLIEFLNKPLLDRKRNSPSSRILTPPEPSSRRPRS